MDDSLLAAFRATDYRVRLGGGYASLRVDQLPPASLLALIGDATWGFITAWNPGSRLYPRPQNRRAQRQLLADIRALSPDWPVLSGVGVGCDGWREPSLLVIGADVATLDTLAVRYGQLGYLHGQGRDRAHLRLLPPA